MEGLNYDETFAPLMQYDSLRLIISLATHRARNTDGLHIKSAILNRDLVE